MSVATTFVLRVECEAGRQRREPGRHRWDDRDLSGVGADQAGEAFPTFLQAGEAVVEPELLGPEAAPEVEVLLGQPAAPF